MSLNTPRTPPPVMLRRMLSLRLSTSVQEACISAARAVPASGTIVLPSRSLNRSMAFRTDSLFTPYVTPSEWRGLPEEVKGYEPRIALCDGSENGLGTVERLFVEGRDVLARPGLLICEIGATQAAAVCAISRNAGYGACEVRKDLAGQPRVVVADW